MKRAARFSLASIFALTVSAALSGAVSGVMPAHAADEAPDRESVLSRFNTTLNAAIPITGTSEGAQPVPADPNNSSQLGRDWISVVANFTSTLVEQPGGAIVQCDWLRIMPEDPAQLEPLKSLHLPISVGSPSLADILAPHGGANLSYGSCAPYETALTPDQKTMIRDQRWDDLAASGIALRADSVIRIMDTANSGILQELHIQSVADPARESRLRSGMAGEEMPTAYILRPLPQ